MSEEAELLAYECFVLAKAAGYDVFAASIRGVEDTHIAAVSAVELGLEIGLRMKEKMTEGFVIAVKFNEEDEFFFAYGIVQHRSRPLTLEERDALWAEVKRSYSG